ncbi:MAG: beta-ketoacyl synthase chain length factor [Candidatus Accumulibacter sp.]|nr:beta-ketoacyl synthase chain length factor [Accumulibacter sp.]
MSASVRPESEIARARGEISFRLPLDRRVFRDDVGGCALAAAGVDFVDPMLRRRLSPLAKLTLSSAFECSKGVSGVRLVYASRHGEIARTVAMLEDIAQGEAVSPARFSLSVLNASAGLFSLISGNPEPATAISAGRSSFGYGLVEAALRFAEDASRPVLYVYSDEPLPTIYGKSHAEEGASRVALALLIGDMAETALHCSVLPTARPASAEPQFRAFLRCFEEGASNWSDGDTPWHWRRPNSQANEVPARPEKTGAGKSDLGI